MKLILGISCKAGNLKGTHKNRLIKLSHNYLIYLIHNKLKTPSIELALSKGNGHWIPLQRVIIKRLYCFLCCYPGINSWKNSQMSRDLRCHEAHETLPQCTLTTEVQNVTKYNNLKAHISTNVIHLFSYASRCLHRHRVALYEHITWSIGKPIEYVYAGEMNVGHDPYLLVVSLLNTLRPIQDGHIFPDDIFKWIFLTENVWIPIKISLKFVP